MSGSVTITHSKPYLSDLRSMSPPADRAADFTRVSTSLSIRSKSPEYNGLRVTAALPAGCRPSSVCSVTQAVARAKSLSSRGSDSFFRPKRTSLIPKWRLYVTLGDRTPHLARDLRQCGEALLQRGMVHEELRGRRLDARRDDEERVHALHL